MNEMNWAFTLERQPDGRMVIEKIKALEALAAGDELVSIASKLKQ